MKYPTATLGDVARFVNGRAFKPSDWSPDGLPIVRIANLTDSAAPINRFTGDVDDRHLIDTGDLLVSWSATLDAFIWTRGPAIVNQHIFKVYERPELVDRMYLYLAIRHAMGALRAQVHGATMQHITRGPFEQFQIRLPPLAEQRRIAARLDSQLAAVDHVRSKVSGQRDEIARMRTQVYASAYAPDVPFDVRPRGRSTRANWRWVRLTDVARLESGHTPSRSHPEWWGGEIPWLALPAIRAVDGMVVNETTEYTNPDGIANSAARILPAGTIAMSRTASVGFVTKFGRPMATSQDFVNWVCGPDLDPDFLLHLLVRSRSAIQALASGAVHKTVYYPTVKAFHICIPGIDEQRRIASNLERQLASIDAALDAANAQLAAAKALPGALLREAFESAS
jgi:type I restriction enzyme S subunit